MKTCKKKTLNTIEAYEHAAYQHAQSIYKKEKDIDDCLVKILSTLPDNTITIRPRAIYVMMPDIFADQIQEVHTVTLDEENHIMLKTKSVTDETEHNINARFCIFDREKLVSIAANKAKDYYDKE